MRIPVLLACWMAQTAGALHGFSPEEPDRFKVKGVIAEVFSVQSREWALHSPLDAHPELLQNSTPKLFCAPEFVVCLHRQNGALCTWEIRGRRLLLVAIESWVYRLNTNEYLTNGGHSELIKSKAPSTTWQLNTPGKFEKLEFAKFPLFTKHFGDWVFADWFTGSIVVINTKGKKQRFNFVKGRLQ